MLISFIIPLYNCETLVGRCLDSIFAANVDRKQYEVIVVDDVSRDHSVDVVKEYSEKHSNISLICQQNAGASAARNAGLRKAQGRYIWFVDADDSIVPAFLGNVIHLFMFCANICTDQPIGLPVCITSSGVAPVCKRKVLRR